MKRASSDAALPLQTERYVFGGGVNNAKDTDNKNVWVQLWRKI